MGRRVIKWTGTLCGKSLKHNLHCIEERKYPLKNILTNLSQKGRHSVHCDWGAKTAVKIIRTDHSSWKPSFRKIGNDLPKKFPEKFLRDTSVPSDVRIYCHQWLSAVGIQSPAFFKNCHKNHIFCKTSTSFFGVPGNCILKLCHQNWDYWALFVQQLSN